MNSTNFMIDTKHSKLSVKTFEKPISIYLSQIESVIKENYSKEIISECSWAKFRWAAATIKTRQVYIFDEKYEELKIDGLEIGTPCDSSGLAPWFDMLNHGDIAHVNCKFFCTSPAHGLVCQTLRDILPGKYCQIL